MTGPWRSDEGEPFNAGDVVVLRGGPEGLNRDGALRYGPEEAGASVRQRASAPLVLDADADGDGMGDVFVRPRPGNVVTHPKKPGSLRVFPGDGEPARALDLTGVPALTGD